MVKRKTQIIILFFSAVLSLAVWLNPTIVKYPFRGLFNTDTLRYRVWAWQIALRGWRDRPFLGWGLNNYQIVFSHYFKPEFQETESSVVWYDHAHNFYLDLLCETGILGLGAFLFFLICLFQKLKRLPQKEKLVLIPVFAGYLIHLFFIFPTLCDALIFLLLTAYVAERCPKNA